MRLIAILMILLFSSCAFSLEVRSNRVLNIKDGSISVLVESENDFVLNLVNEESIIVSSWEKDAFKHKVGETYTLNFKLPPNFEEGEYYFELNDPKDTVVFDIKIQHLSFWQNIKIFFSNIYRAIFGID